MKAREKISRADSFPGSSWDFGMRRRTLRCQTSINCLNADEARHCTDTARTKGHKDVIPSEARDLLLACACSKSPIGCRARGARAPAPLGKASIVRGPRGAGARVQRARLQKSFCERQRADP